MNLFIGLSLIGLVVVLSGLVVHYWRDNRILKIDLECKNNNMSVLYDVNDRYKLRIVELEKQVSTPRVMVSFGLLIAAEWGGVRIGADPADGSVSGLLIRSPAGLLLIKYPTHYAEVLAHLPEDTNWQWGGPKHRLVCEMHEQVLSDLLEYAKLRESERSQGVLDQDLAQKKQEAGDANG